jgi:hypothetical protein
MAMLYRRPKHLPGHMLHDYYHGLLGILSGIGFIGAGAIVRRDNFVAGVTTAATIWFLTVLGSVLGEARSPWDSLAV